MVIDRRAAVVLHALARSTRCQSSLNLLAHLSLRGSYLILDTLPPEYDARVKAMEVDERPTEDYNDIGYVCAQQSLCRVTENLLSFHLSIDSSITPSICRGLHKEINELKEAIVLPLTHAHLFQEIGIRPPKGTAWLPLHLQPNESPSY